MRHPRKLIFVCTGSDCKKSGGKALKKQLKAELKDGELKGNCKLISTKCMDMCKSAPVVIVEDHFLKKTNCSKILLQLKKS